MRKVTFPLPATHLTDYHNRIEWTPLRRRKMIPRLHPLFRSMYNMLKIIHIHMWRFSLIKAVQDFKQNFGLSLFQLTMLFIYESNSRERWECANDGYRSVYSHRILSSHIQGSANGEKTTKNFSEWWRRNGRRDIRQWDESCARCTSTDVSKLVIIKI